MPELLQFFAKYERHDANVYADFFAKQQPIERSLSATLASGLKAVL